MKLIVEQNQQLVAANALHAKRFSTRALGLMGKREFAPFDALLLPRCRCVHMFFMRFPIDVVFLDSDGVIVAAQEHLRPWRISRFIPAAVTSVELPDGRIAECALVPGIRLRTVE